MQRGAWLLVREQPVSETSLNLHHDASSHRRTCCAAGAGCWTRGGPRRSPSRSGLSAVQADSGTALGLLTVLGRLLARQQRLAAMLEHEPGTPSGGHAVLQLMMERFRVQGLSGAWRVQAADPAGRQVYALR